jgi:hypothetical protein
MASQRKIAYHIDPESQLKFRDFIEQWYLQQAKDEY